MRKSARRTLPDGDFAEREAVVEVVVVPRAAPNALVLDRIRYRRGTRPRGCAYRRPRARLASSGELNPPTKLLYGMATGLGNKKPDENASMTPSTRRLPPEVLIERHSINTTIEPFDVSASVHDRGDYASSLGLTRTGLRVPRGLRVLRFDVGSDEFMVLSFERNDGAQDARVDVLSPSERQVAEYAAEGRSNAEIASARSTSVRTVEKQIAEAYRKLGVGSRRGLVAFIRQKG